MSVDAEATCRGASAVRELSRRMYSKEMWSRRWSAAAAASAAAAPAVDTAAPGERSALRTEDDSSSTPLPSRLYAVQVACGCVCVCARAHECVGLLGAPRLT